MTALGPAELPHGVGLALSGIFIGQPIALPRPRDRCNEDQ